MINWKFSINSLFPFLFSRDENFLFLSRKDIKWESLKALISLITMVRAIWQLENQLLAFKAQFPFSHILSFYFISLTFRIHLKLSVWCKQLMNIPKATSICKSTWLIFEIENTVRESENYSPCRLLKSALSISTTNIQWVNANCHTNAMNDFSNIRWELENGLKFKNKNL